MRIEKKEVKSKSKTVGIAEYAVFDAISEAVEELGEAKVLELVNAQHRTNALNVIRGNAVGKPTKTAIQRQAMSEITPDEFGECAGDPQALDNLISSKVAVVEKRLAEEAEAAGEVAGEVDPVDDDDE